MNLRRLGLKVKIGIGFGSLLAIIAGMGIVGYRSAEVNEELANAMQIDSSKKDITLLLRQAVLLQRIGTRDILMGRDNDPTHLFEHGEADVRQAMGDLKPLLATDEARKLYAGVAAAYFSYTARNEQVVAVYRAGDAAGAVEMFKAPQGLVVSDDLANAMNAMSAVFDLQRQDALSRQVAFDDSSKRLMTVLALAGLAPGLTIAFVIARSIVTAIQRMLSMIETVSSNNLTGGDLAVESDDEMGRAALGLNAMKNGLRDVILSIATTADDVSLSSQGISSTASQAAGSAESQKHQVHQITATMQQMTATVREVSLHSSAAARSASSAAENARDGGRIVEGVLGRMRGIAQSVRESVVNIEHLGAKSDDIGRIVGVIEEIAGQTNLLALNAAIEAARAGDQGRGFAVVAGEVRRLADRTGSATQEIAAVIQNVQAMTAAAVQQMRSGTAAVDEGVEITSQAGESIRRIVGEADKLGTMVAQIASAAAQQATAAEEVTASMGQISTLTAESSDGAQLSASACERLLNLALGLQTMVDRFEVGARKAIPVRSAGTAKTAFESSVRLRSGQALKAFP